MKVLAFFSFLILNTWAMTMLYLYGKPKEIFVKMAESFRGCEEIGRAESHSLKFAFFDFGVIVC